MRLGGNDDGGNDQNFAQKLANYTKAHPGDKSKFTGPLAFLSGYQYLLGSGLLTGLGAATEFSAGVTFWNQYGRILYNATAGQVAYNASYFNGTTRPKPVLRTTGQSRIEDSQITWALGFFGPSFEPVPNPKLTNFTNHFNVVIIPEGGTENNTLASYDSCANDNVESIGFIGDDDLFTYIPKYLTAATGRLQKYVPSGFKLTTNDTYAMQSICAYETQYIGSSDFCGLFTADEWSGFENTLDIEYYYDYAWGNPTGRAQGIGYLQELFARLQHQYITVSNTSVNTSITNNSADFPLHQPFYADFSHDDIIISALTALSLDYLRDPPSLTAVPPAANRSFILSHLTPFGARLVTEVIGCDCNDPKEESRYRTQYSPSQYGYDSKTATHKFIRMRLNEGILPLSSIRGGACAGRGDGLCAMSKFIESQKNSTGLAEYQYACFGNYTIDNAKYPGRDYDGAIFP